MAINLTGMTRPYPRDEAVNGARVKEGRAGEIRLGL